MKRIQAWIVVGAALGCMGAAVAQGGPGMMGAGPGASGAAPGPRMGMMKGPGAHWNADTTAGWMMMTPEERTAFQQRMAAVKTQGDCRAAMSEHREQMAARAKEQGKTLPTPRRDACAALKP